MENLLHIHLFGPPDVLLGELHPDTFPAQKVKLLFFYLVLYRQVTHARSVLAGLFWGDSTEDRARHSLNTAIWRLRHWLESFQTSAIPLLLVQEQQIAFNAASTYWVDIAEFEEHIAWARQMSASLPDQAAASLTRAVELYRGELLEGCYADWCLVERDRLQQLFLKALVHLMVYHGGRREYPQAIALAQRLLQNDPLREDVQRELIKLFVLDEKPAEALLQYRRCVAVLREELNIEPMPETQELFRRLILKSGVPPSNLNSSAVGASRAVSRQSNSLLQANSFLHEIEAALGYLLTVREELDKGIAELEQIKNATLFGSKSKPKT